MAPPIGGFPLYNADIQDGSGFPAGGRRNSPAAVKAADGVLFVTPEYNWSMPGVLKNAIDWVSRMQDQPFKEKPVAIQSCSQGPLGGARMQYHWRMSMTFLGAYHFRHAGDFRRRRAQNKFDKETLALTDQPTRRNRQDAACGICQVHREDEALIFQRCHSGTRRRRGPGIHSPSRRLWIPGPLASRAPQNA